MQGCVDGEAATRRWTGALHTLWPLTSILFPMRSLEHAGLACLVTAVRSEATLSQQKRRGRARTHCSPTSSERYESSLQQGQRHRRRGQYHGLQPTTQASEGCRWRQESPRPPSKLTPTVIRLRNDVKALLPSGIPGKTGREEGMRVGDTPSIAERSPNLALHALAVDV